jgi:hypothetical protein
MHAVVRREGAGLLTLAALASSAIAVLHLCIIVAGAPAYRYFVFPPAFATAAESGSIVPALVTLGLAACFATYAAYGFSGGGRIVRLPRLRHGLVIISAIYLMRGLAVAPQLVLLGLGRANFPLRHIPFSLIALATGVVYALGTARRWEALASPGQRDYTA